MQRILNLLLFTLIFCMMTFQALQEQQEQFPHRVWVYWSDTEETMPMIYKLCYRKIKEMTFKSQWQLILLTDSNLFQYVDQKQFTELKQKAKVKYIQQLVDMIKIMIMIKHGGVYIDLSSILIEDLSWLQRKNLPFNLQVINKYGDFPDVLFFYNSMFLNNNIQVTKQGTKTLTFPNFQTWFMAARPNSQLMKEWRKVYQNIFLNDFSYFQKFRKQHNLYLKNLDRQNHALIETTLTYLSVNVAMQYVLQKKQQEFDKQLTIFSSSQDRKLAVHYYKVWTISCHTGPMTVLPKTGISNHYQFFINLISKNPQHLDSQQAETSLNPRYFIKLTGQQATKMDYLVSKEKTIQNFQYEINQFSYIFNVVNMTCQNHLFFQKDSPIEKYLLRDNLFALQNLNVQILTSDEVNKICHQSIVDSIKKIFFLVFIMGTLSYFILKISTTYQNTRKTNKRLYQVNLKQQQICENQNENQNEDDFQDSNMIIQRSHIQN